MSDRTTKKRRSQNAPATKKAAKYPWIAADLRPLAEPLDKLVPNEKNVRKHSVSNVAAIAASLDEFGQRKPIVANRRGGEIEAGNAVFEAAQSIGWTHLAVVWVEDDPAAAAGFALADNRTAEMAIWDEFLLNELINDLEEDCPALYESLLLRDLRAELGDLALNGGNCDPDEVPAPPDEPITKPGDLWILGDHRLLCGDSAKPEDVDRLLDGQPIHLVNTDPPYNVSHQPRSNAAIAAGNSSFKKKGKGKVGQITAKDRPLENDSMSAADFDKMFSSWFVNIARVLEPGRCFYIWGGYVNCGNYPPAMKANQLYFSQAIIWVKEHPVPTRKDFMGNHEWCFYGWREGAGHKYFGPNNATDVWNVKKVSSQKMVHLTEKPVELAIRAMQYSTRPGENILDLFAGSGSTLIAAHQTSRRSFLMELDPLYCDVIVNRWRQFTGRNPKRQNKKC